MIIRAKRKTNFTIISNVGMDDERLSFKAKGLLAYLLTKPDNWQVNERHLETIGPDGVTAVRSALKELEICGYLRRERERDEHGLFVWTSIVYDEPCVENPSMDNPSADNSTLISTEETRTDGVRTEEKAVEAATTAPTVGEAWADNMPGMMTPSLLDQLKELEKEYTVHEIVAAINIAVKRNKRTLGYVEGVLRRGVDLPPTNGAKPKTSAYITDPVTGERKQVLA